MARFTIKTQSNDTAVQAISGGEGVHGESTSLSTAAVVGVQVSTDPAGTGAGIYGESRGAGAGIVGVNNVSADAGPAGPGGPGGQGAYFGSTQKEAVFAETKSSKNAAIAGILNNPNGEGAAIYGEHIAGGTAGFFKGNVIVTGDISFPGADFAEHFTLQENITANPGTVMTFSETGELVPCSKAYEKMVVGVIAGGGTFRSGIIMDKQGSTTLERQPIALVGKVFCKVDANYGSINVGDLLTSSTTEGHAMKASDSTRAFGAVIGKAMAPLIQGTGMIPILIALQ